MSHILDARYTFTFCSAEGTTYQRQCYWETLYAFTPKSQPVIASVGTVPHSGIHYALYETFKKQTSRSIPRELFASTPGAHLELADDRTDMLKLMEEILPARSITAPLEFLEETETRLEEATAHVLTDFGIENGLNQLVQPGGAETIERRFADPTDVLHALADVKGEDVGWVALSYHVDAAIKTQIRQTLETSTSDHALAHHGDLENDIYARLYSNPAYLEFVKRVLKAKGGYASPAVRNFLTFYLKCLDHKIRAHAHQTQTDPLVFRKKLESLLGAEKGGGHYALNYHDLTLIGHLLKGTLTPDADDPDTTGSSFKIAPDIDLAPLVFQEIEGPLQRFIIKKFIDHTFNIHHNIRNVRYIDEPEKKIKP